MYGYIYKITNLINNGVYVGQTSRTIMERFSDHIINSNKYVDGKSGYSHLYRAMKKYGSENFVIEQIDSADSKEELDEKEKYWILYYRSCNLVCYNIADGGTGGNTWDNHTLEEKLIIGNKISTANSGKIHGAHSEETRKKISEAVKDAQQYRSDESKQLESQKKRQAALSRAPKSQETRKKLSESNKGKHFKTDDEKEFLRQNMLGKVAISRDDEQKYVFLKDLQIYLDQGWQKGGKPKHLSDESRKSANLKRAIARNQMSLQERELLKQKKSERMSGINNPMYGSAYKWMNDHFKNYRIALDQIDHYIQIGYELGRVKKCIQSQ